MAEMNRETDPESKIWKLTVLERTGSLILRIRSGFGVNLF